MRGRIRRQSAVVVWIGVGSASLHAQTPLGGEVSYQGQLQESGSPASGSFPMVFTLWDADTAGMQVGWAPILN